MGYLYYIEPLIDPTKPDTREEKIYKIRKAKKIACRRFLETAVKAIRTGRGEGYK